MMTADPQTTDSIKQNIANALVPQFDHVEYDEGGPILIVVDGFWFELETKPIDNGESE